MSIKHLAVPFLVLGIAVYGCSSDNSGGGHGGQSGSAAGHGGTTGTGGKGGSGGTGGSGGATGGSGGGAGGAGGTPLPACTSTSATSAMMSAADYCRLLLEGGCGTTPPSGFTIPYANMGECTSAYNALTTSVQMCRSYHLCNAYSMSLSPHCFHAIGMMGLCGS
jgi:hypothetical protein